MKNLIIILTGAALLFSACAKPPTEEMNKAIEALNRAENDADTVLFAQNTLNLARDALVRMQDEANAKRFDSARTHAADVVTFAERALNEGRTNASRARDEAAALINSAASALAETEAALNTALERKIPVDAPALIQSLDTAKQALVNARNSLAVSDFTGSEREVQAVRAVLSSIQAAMNQAAQAESRKA